MARHMLTPLEEAFCQAYVSDPKRIGTNAALTAGYAPKSAFVQASNILRRPKVIQRIKELEREALEAAGYTPDALRPVIMRRLVGLATTDLADVAQVIYPDDAKRQAALDQLTDRQGGQIPIDFGEPILYVKPTSEWTPEERAAIKGLKSTKEGLQVELHDHLAAVKLLAEIVGLAPAADLNVNLSVTDSLAEARERAFKAEASPKAEAQQAEASASRGEGEE
jgi:hypothetical protein